jgi:MoaA/NifB/PqqE/SkfB family radical SAM enzyme
MRLTDKLRIAKKIVSSSLRRKMNIITAEIALTYRCNLSCEYCDLSVFEKNGKETEMSTAQLNQAFDKLKMLGAERVNMSGGEPLIRKDIGEILSNALNRGFKVSLTTNGAFVSEYVDILKKIDQVILSLDGEKTTHDCLRGSGAYAAAIQALNLCKANGIDIMISAVLTNKTTVADLLFLLSISEEFNIYCLIQPLTSGVYIDNQWSVFKKAESLKPAFEQLSKIRDLIIGDSRGYRIIGGDYYLNKMLDLYKAKETISRQINCMAGKLFLCLSPSGRIMPCSMRDYPGISDKKIWECSNDSLNELRMLDIKCNGCACYSYIILNQLSRVNPSAILHCLNLKY